jgi:mgtE-like transporter
MPDDAARASRDRSWTAVFPASSWARRVSRRALSLWAVLRSPRRVLRSGAALLGPGGTARQSLVALVLNSATSIVAGLVLGAITGTLERLPGLLVLVPAAIGLRGNIFSSFGNRLSTAIHTGQFELSWRRDSLLVQNVLAAMILTAFMSVALAALAKVVAVGVGVRDSAPLSDLVMISVLGGLLASVVVLVASVALAWGAVRFRWDLDNVVAPVVSTLGDVLTLPALWVASLLAGVRVVAPLLGWVLAVLSVVAFGSGVFARGRTLRQVTRESWPILLAAALLSTLAGLVLQQRLELLAALPALLVLQPAFVSSAGALGGILSSRLSSKFHLGLVVPAAVPPAEARLDAVLILLLGLPVYVFNALGAHLAAVAAGLPSPGALPMLAVSLTAGLLSVVFVIAVAYYGTIAAVTVRVDPDTYGIPVVTSSVDFAGSVALIAFVVAFGFA